MNQPEFPSIFNQIGDRQPAQAQSGNATMGD